MSFRFLRTALRSRPVSTHPDSDESESTPAEKLMSFWDHLAELRGTLIKSVMVVIAFTALLGYYIVDVMALLQEPFDTVRSEYPQHNIQLVAHDMSDGLNMVVKTCLFGGFLLATPFILFFVAQFVAPALTNREKDAVVPLCIASFVLFICGMAFGFFILVPSAIRAFIEVNILLKWPMNAWSITGYYGNMTMLVFGLGLAFQFPLVLVLLTWLGLANAAAMRTYRRHAIVGIFVLAAIATPGSDVNAQVLFAVPLCVLYEIAIFVCARIEKRRERPTALLIIALFTLLQRSKSLASRSAHPPLTGAA
jgi:sec-independent protein translocase protein TatC